MSGQDDAENIFCLVDMHALTVPKEPDVLRRQTLEYAMVLLAAGIDQAKSRLFVQSHVREHGELAWYLSCVASMGQLQRMTQFKEKSEAQRGEAVSYTHLFRHRARRLDGADGGGINGALFANRRPSVAPTCRP